MSAPRSGIMTASLVNSLRTQPKLPTHSWYFIAGVTLSALNLPDEIPKLLTNAIEHGVEGEPSQAPSQDEQLKVARRMREGLVKSAAVVGLPKTINALFSLKSATPPHLLDEPMAFSPSSRPIELYDMPSSQILNRGQHFFDKVYGKVSARVMGQMDRSGTEDLGVTARLMYGYLLSNTNILSPAESSYVLLAGLIPQDVNPQLKGHLKGALNNGASLEEVKAVRDIVIKICEASGMKRLAEGASGWGWKDEVANL